MYKTILALGLLLAAPAAYAQDAPIVGTWRGTYYQGRRSDALSRHDHRQRHDRHDAL